MENETSHITPMWQQYIQIKKEYPEFLLFFRMGDFFELFFDDALVAAPVLNITLTHKGKHLGKVVPMCGVNVASHEVYAARLVRAGFKIAICDQLESPEEAKKRGNKSLVKRGVIRIITPGTLIEESMLDTKNHNFLMAIYPHKKKSRTTNRSETISPSTTEDMSCTLSYAAIDISTDTFLLDTIPLSMLSAALTRFQPSEILVPETTSAHVLETIRTSQPYSLVTTLSDTKFNHTIEQQRLQQFFNVSTLESFGIENQNECAVCGAIVEYLQITQKENLLSLSHPRKMPNNTYMVIDATTYKHLEIVQSYNYQQEYSLLSVIDRTFTAFGSRLLHERLFSPILDINTLNARLDVVDFFIQHTECREKLQELLSQCPDFERAIMRLRYNKLTKRDIIIIKDALNVIHKIHSLHLQIPHDGELALADIPDISKLSALLNKAICENKDEDFIAQNFHHRLDEIRQLRDNGQNLIYQLQNEYIAKSAISSLKIKQNNIFGWFIEIPTSQKSKILPEFVHKQTMVNAIRYSSQRLDELQLQLNNASYEYDALEKEVIASIIKIIAEQMNVLMQIKSILSRIDNALSAAIVATENRYVRPIFTEDNTLHIVEGRHPVIEKICETFTHNDCQLSQSSRMCLLTGPNMSGKSTYLRQNAIIIMMAQMGMFVPATTAHIGIVDRLFSRIGASDDLSQGRSTFMVEMIETATILNQATKKSFVILDEVGRGTSTYDGLSIAWAVCESLFFTNQCRTLFATHYNELAQLKTLIPSLLCQTSQIKEWNKKIIFQHKIIPGVTQKSYGIHVAELAGLPKAVITRATQLLKNYSQDNRQASLDFTQNDHPQNLSLSAPTEITTIKHTDKNTNDALTLSQLNIIKKLSSMDLGSVTPKQALDTLYDLQEELKKHNA